MILTYTTFRMYTTTTTNGWRSCNSSSSDSDSDSDNDEPAAVAADADELVQCADMIVQCVGLVCILLLMLLLAA